MQTVYWSCLYGGIIFAVVTVIFGDILGDVFGGLFDSASFASSDFLSPVVIVGGITVFGGAGIMLERLTSLEVLIIAVFSMMIAILMSTLCLFYLRPTNEER